MPRGENRQSVLLSREENEQVFSLIGPKCQSLATAVVQLFTTEGPGHSEWKKRDTGVLCLIKDNGKRTYFFRIYCLYRKALIWEHEVYLQIEYKSPRPFLHTFEAEEYMTAFNFANVEEAKLLQKVLVEKMELRRRKREEKRQRALLAARANSVSAGAPPMVRQNGAPPQPPLEPPPPTLVPKASLSASNTNTLIKRGKKRGSRLTKADIGAPQDFKHISHVGWDPQKGYDKLPDDELKSFFSKAGVSETQLEDEETRVFIYDFIETHGGLDAVKSEVQAPAPPPSSKPTGPLRPPPPPSSAAPPVPNRNAAPAQPPAPPSRAPPPPPARAVPPPPPAPLIPRNPPPPRPIQPPSSAPPPVPPPPPPGVAPPPPPPPPLAPAPPPAPPMPLPQDTPAAGDPRSALMESIRSGNKNLRKVEATEKVPVIDDSRSNLLSEIRQGVELKAVPTRSPSGSGGSGRAPACGLAGALARALEERSRAIHSSDSDMSETSDADDEWD